jgi:hypothetical protein
MPAMPEGGKLGSLLDDAIAEYTAPSPLEQVVRLLYARVQQLEATVESLSDGVSAIDLKVTNVAFNLEGFSAHGADAGELGGGGGGGRASPGVIAAEQRMARRASVSQHLDEAARQAADQAALELLDTPKNITVVQGGGGRWRVMGRRGWRRRGWRRRGAPTPPRQAQQGP